jgi:xanthine dehydrogenase accessory factor
MQRQADSGLAIVVGAADVGSATAVALYRAGYPVVLCDDVDPPWPRRGMAFTNAWYIGSAELDEVGAVFCASVRSIPTALARSRMIVATTWSWAGVAASLPPTVVVHAYRRGRSDEDFRAPEAPGWATIGIGPGFVAGGNVDVVVESAGSAPGTVIRAGAASSIDDETWEQDALTESVRASVSGRFTTGRRIGAAVLRGETIGAIGLVPIAAPVAGVLRGLTARGARVTTGMRVAEIDPRGDPVACFGISDRSRAIARGVLAAVAEAMPRGEAAEMAPLPLHSC